MRVALANAIVPYLADRGISQVYCSPYFRARPGSLHGYDVIDQRDDCVLVPRLSARLLVDKPGLPRGEEVWADTTVELPEELRGAAFVSIFGTAVHLPADANGIIRVGTVLADFPIGCSVRQDGYRA
jgi:maltooligosyltrehalose synthase